MIYFWVVGISYISKLKKIIESAKNDEQLLDAIVNAPFTDIVRATELDLGIIVLLLVNKKTNTIDRIVLSNTEQAAGAVRMSEKPFKEIKIPVGYKGNLITEAIKTGKIQCITDWKYLFVPWLSPTAARFNQAGAGIEFSCVYPLKARDGGALIFSFFQVGTNIKKSHNAFMKSYAKIVDERLGA